MMSRAQIVAFKDGNIFFDRLKFYICGTDPIQNGVPRHGILIHKDYLTNLHLHLKK